MSWLSNNFAYRKAKRLVDATVNSPKKLLTLASSAQDKINDRAKKSIQPLIDPIQDSYRLIRAYANGSYRDVPIENFGLIVAAIIYFVMPLDALPDFIAGFGFTDDAAVLAWTFNKVRDELAQFECFQPIFSYNGHSSYYLLVSYLYDKTD
jgi:uncharacterized membrane protein YkvA (DUF1232 family)